MVFFMNIKVEPEWFDIVMTGLSNVPTDKDGRKIVKKLKKKLMSKSFRINNQVDITLSDSDILLALLFLASGNIADTCDVFSNELRAQDNGDFIRECVNSYLSENNDLKAADIAVLINQNDIKEGMEFVNVKDVVPFMSKK